MALELQDIEDDRNEQSSSTARKLVRVVLMRSFKFPGGRSSKMVQVGAMRHARRDPTVCTYVHACFDSRAALATQGWRTFWPFKSWPR